MPSRRRVRFTRLFWRDVALAVLLVVTGFALFGFAPARTRLRLERLRADGNETTGVVTDVAADGGRYRVRYRFEVDGTTYSGALRVPLRRFAERYVRGDSTPVAYLAADPSVSVPRAKQEIDRSFIEWTTGPALAQATAITGALALALPWICGIALRQRTLLRHGNLIGGLVLTRDGARVRYEFTTPAGERYERIATLRVGRAAAGDRVDVCWMPRRPGKSRLRQELRYVAIAGE